jgi:hypothetical protein
MRCGIAAGKLRQRHIQICGRVPGEVLAWVIEHHGTMTFSYVNGYHVGAAAAGRGCGRGYCPEGFAGGTRRAGIVHRNKEVLGGWRRIGYGEGYKHSSQIYCSTTQGAVSLYVILPLF